MTQPVDPEKKNSYSKLLIAGTAVVLLGFVLALSAAYTLTNAGASTTQVHHAHILNDIGKAVLLLGIVLLGLYILRSPRKRSSKK